jgi:hypothetical protein
MVDKVIVEHNLRGVLPRLSRFAFVFCNNHQNAFALHKALPAIRFENPAGCMTRKLSGDPLSIERDAEVFSLRQTTAHE